MSTTALIVEYLIIGGIGLIPLTMLLAVLLGPRAQTLVALFATNATAGGAMFLMLSYVVGVLFNLLSRKLLKPLERRVVRGVLERDFPDSALGLLSGRDSSCPAAPEQAGGSLLAWQTKLALRRARYDCYTRGTPQNALQISRHNHMKRISRAMVVVLPLTAVEGGTLLCLDGAVLGGLALGTLLLLLSLAFVLGYRSSCKSYARAIMYSRLALDEGPHRTPNPSP